MCDKNSTAKVLGQLASRNYSN